MFDIPILIITYKREKSLKKILNIVKKIDPIKLYISSNAPPKNNLEISDKVYNVRNIINNFKIKGNIYRLYRSKHLSVYDSIPKSINWFFLKEKYGIILEDDCIPVKDFFYFCETLLKKYLNNKLINSIGGSNFCKKKISEIYYFSKYNHIWGWATWRRSWKNFDLNIKFWKKYKKTNHWKLLHDNDNEKEYWEKKFDKIYGGSIYTWDYSWQACAWYKSQLSIIPNKPLVKNVGFDDEATYTIGRNFNYHAMRTNLIIDKYNDNIIQNLEADNDVFKNFFREGKKFKFAVLLLFTDPVLFFLKLKSYLTKLLLK